IAYGKKGLEIIYVGNIIRPAKVVQYNGTLHDYFCAYSVVINDSYIYVSTEDGVRMINIDDSFDPIEMTRFLSVFGSGSDIVIQGSYLYLAHGSAGFIILQLRRVDKTTTLPSNLSIPNSIVIFSLFILITSILLVLVYKRPQLKDRLKKN
ncbi:MAG: hypothetical protein EAX86_01415, partial [Candidatus Heimdallarchaeota archaeon]|nr:hypothetical protein [Candidatus Heimdallarchaeota archaeon]